MFTNWLTYRAVAEHLDRVLKGYVLGEVFTQDRNELIIDAAKDGVQRSLHFSAHPQSAFLLLRDAFSRARKNTVTLMPETRGKTITSISIVADDRIMRIALDDGSAILAVLYATKSNLLYYNALGELTESFKKPLHLPVIAELEFDDSIDVPGKDELTQAVSAFPNRTVPALLKKLRPWLSGTLADEICRRAGISGTTVASTLADDTVHALLAALEETLDECCAPPWYIAARHGLPVAFSLVALHEDGLDTREYGDIHEALFEYYKLRERTRRLAGMKTAIMKTIDRELERARRGLEKSAEEGDLNAKADLYEKYGNLLMINLERKPEQPGQMTVDDMFDGMGRVISIPLDQKLSVLENSQRYYEKARSTRISIDYVNQRRKELALKTGRLERARAIFEEIGDYPTLRDRMAEEKELMNELGFTAKGEKQEQFPFRRFTVAGGFEVWAGKNSQNNDLLTVRNSKPNDIWFHARGVGGSHVVIKVDSAPGKPGKDTIREAAAIAAYYSKHRNAGSVPVAYTEKKYVNKPRGVPAGTVTLSREKVIMVQPGLPEGSTEGDD